MTIQLREKNSNRPLGVITETQLQFLLDQLEEEALDDQDYSITAMLLDLFESENADAELVTLLRDALGDRDEVIIVWTE